MEIPNDPPITLLELSEGRYFTSMANALLVGFSKAYANTQIGINVTLKSLSFTSTDFTIGSYDYSDKYTTYKNFSSAAKFLYVYITSKENITSETTTNDIIYQPPTFLIPTTTPTSFAVVETNTNSERNRSTNVLEYTVNNCRIYGGRYNTKFDKITYYGDIVILYGI